MPAFDPGPQAALARCEIAGAFPDPIRIGRAEVRVGTASWTDRTLTARGVFYPDDAHTPEARLRHYASRFSAVEVDSSFYALPSEENASIWVERTPPGFSFDVKAFALMTGHPTATSRLPSFIRDALPREIANKARIYAKDLPDDVSDLVWETFASAVRPLAEVNRLGAVFLQYAPWVVPSRESPAMLEHARARLAGLPIAVELRNARWFTPKLRDRTLDLLRRMEMSYVVVDEPQGTPASVPPEVAVTSPRLAVLRMHGQRADLWEKRGVPVVERYRYLYSTDEMEKWVPRVLALAAEAEQVHVVFNNCYANYGVCNAAEMAALLTRYGAGGKE